MLFWARVKRFVVVSMNELKLVAVIKECGSPKVTVVKKGVT